MQSRQHFASVLLSSHIKCHKHLKHKYKTSTNVLKFSQSLKIHVSDSNGEIFILKIVMPTIKYNYSTQGCYKNVKSEGDSLFFYREISAMLMHTLV